MQMSFIGVRGVQKEGPIHFSRRGGLLKYLEQGRSQLIVGEKDWLREPGKGNSFFLRETTVISFILGKQG